MAALAGAGEGLVLPALLDMQPLTRWVVLTRLPPPLDI
jgi:hypothetical protein